MKKQNIYNFYIISILSGVTIYMIYKFLKKKEKFEDCPKTTSGISDMPDKASEACKKISSKADEIKAHYGGVSNILQNMPGFALFNPNNYKAGDNTTDNMMRNIINTNLSKCEIEKINNTCDNTTSVYQSNSIDVSDCDYCKNNPCPIIGNRQKNVSKAQQTCVIQTSIKALSDKKNSIDAQALAKVFQEAEGLLSGSNTTKTENCNIIDQDLSSQNYLETKNECLNNLTSTQINKIKGCGPVIDNIQENESIKIQECMLGTKIEKKNIVDAETKLFSRFDIEQYTKGIDTTASIISSVSSFVCLFVIAFIFLQDFE